VRTYSTVRTASVYSTLTAMTITVMVVVAVTPSPADANIAAVGVAIRRTIIRIRIWVHRIWRHPYPNTEPDSRISMRGSEERQHPRQCNSRNSKFS